MSDSFSIKAPLSVKSIEKLFSIFQKYEPHPKTELQYRNHYTLLVAVVLSAQATDKSVNKATKELFTTVYTPETMITLGLDGLKKHIKSIGLYNNKAKNIINLSKILAEEYSSKIPNNREELEKLPGVGRKTANVILNIAFNQLTVAVDTHIFRLSNRLGLAPGNTPLAVEKKLLQVIPKKYLRDSHHWLILHGRYICKAQKPSCSTCNVSHLCQYMKKEKLCIKA